MLQALTGDNASILTEFAENLDGKPLPGSGDVVRAVGEGGNASASRSRKRR